MEKGSKYKVTVHGVKPGEIINTATIARGLLDDSIPMDFAPACTHDWAFLQGDMAYRGDTGSNSFRATHRATYRRATFYCRRCLEYRTVEGSA